MTMGEPLVAVGGAAVCTLVPAAGAGRAPRIAARVVRVAGGPLARARRMPPPLVALPAPFPLVALRASTPALLRLERALLLLPDLARERVTFSSTSATGSASSTVISLGGLSSRSPLYAP